MGGGGATVTQQQNSAITPTQAQPRQRDQHKGEISVKAIIRKWPQVPDAMGQEEPRVLSTFMEIFLR